MGNSWAKVDGRNMIDWAKMIGMTPAELTESGRWVVAPPKTLRPITLRGYCTGMRRWARVIMITAMITNTIAATMKIST